MTRFELLRSIAPVLSECLVVCNLGLPSQELYQIQDSEKNFYMLGSMGLCSSVGLGLALAVTAPVVAVDGDGSVLMNAGTLVTIAHHAPANFNLLIVDNGVYGSTGNQLTGTSGRASLAKMAEAAGCATVAECTGEETAEMLKGLIARPHPTVLVSKVLPGNAAVPVVPLEPPMLGERFRKAAAEFTRKR